jgi:hypothetical protein
MLMYLCIATGFPHGGASHHLRGRGCRRGVLRDAGTREPELLHPLPQVRTPLTQRCADGGCVSRHTQPVVHSSHAFLCFRLLDIVYPGDCGFKYETGGMMADLRQLTAKQGAETQQQ